MTEQELIQKIINVALSEVGYLEKKSNSQLYDKTANAGTANYTKYGKEMHDIYPSVMDYPAYWCDTFVDWIFYKVCGVANAKGLLGGDFNDYTVASAQLYKNKNAYYKSNPKVGDQIFFNNGTRINHTGIVYKVDSQRVYTVEGNTGSGSDVIIPNGGCVAKKSYLLTNKKIDGYGRPLYSYYASKIGNSSSSTLPQPTKVIREVIDISHHNTINLSQTATKYKDVIIRVGYRASATGILTLDKKFLIHAQDAINNGFRMGFYIWDQSMNEAEAREQADWMVGLIKPLPVSYPLYIDSEYANQKHDGRADGISKEQRTRNIIAFCERIKELGYTPGVYASDSWFKSMVDFNQLENYEIWCARYSSVSPTISKYEMWQYGSTNVPGSKNPIDINRLYKDYSTNNATPSTPDATFYNTVTASSLNVRNRPSTLGKVVDVIHVGNKLNIYALQNNWCKISETENKWCSYKYIRPSSGLVTNCSKLNCRQSPVTGKVAFILSSGSQIHVIGQDSSGWYFIEHDGKVGYVSNKYISLL